VGSKLDGDNWLLLRPDVTGPYPDRMYHRQLAESGSRLWVLARWVAATGAIVRVGRRSLQKREPGFRGGMYWGSRVA